MEATVALYGSVISVIGVIGVAALAAWQARKGARDSPYEALSKRVVELEAADATKSTQITDLRRQVRHAEDRATEARSLAAQAVAENAVLVDYHLATIRGVADGTVPPWLPIPWEIRHRIVREDLPPWPPPPEETP